MPTRTIEGAGTDAIRRDQHDCAGATERVEMIEDRLEVRPTSRRENGHARCHVADVTGRGSGEGRGRASRYAIEETPHRLVQRVHDHGSD